MNSGEVPTSWYRLSVFRSAGTRFASGLPTFVRPVRPGRTCTQARIRRRTSTCPDQAPSKGGDGWVSLFWMANTLHG